jgi:hypothetical protein
LNENTGNRLMSLFPDSLLEAMAVLCRKIETVDFLKAFDLLPRIWRERQLSLKGMQHHSFDEITERYVFVFGERLENLQDALFDSNPSLDPLDRFQGFA